MQIIPTSQSVSARWQIEFNANSSVFVLVFYWNTRESAWYFDILDSQLNPILMGTKIVPSIALLRQYETVRNIIGGDFILIDQEYNMSTSNLNFDNFGVRYFFEYLTLDEIKEVS